MWRTVDAAGFAARVSGRRRVQDELFVDARRSVLGVLDHGRSLLDVDCREIVTRELCAGMLVSRQGMSRLTTWMTTGLTTTGDRPMVVSGGRRMWRKQMM